MSSSLGALRGASLRSHLQNLSAKYNWSGNLAKAAATDIPPSNNATGAGEGDTRRMSIQQSPARSLYISQKPNVAATTHLTAFVLPDSSDDESGSESGCDEDIAGADITFCLDDFSSNSSVGPTGIENVENSCARPYVSQGLFDDLSLCDDEGGLEDEQDESQFILEYVPPAPPAKVKAATKAQVIKKPATSTPSRAKPPKALGLYTTPARAAAVSVPPSENSKASTAFRRKKAALAKSYYESFNTAAFNRALPVDLLVVWNKRLLTTAGITKMKLTSMRQSIGGTADPKGAMVRTKAASIELSEKVCDSEERLKTTLLHEMCHAAAWLLDGERKPPHGPAFWKYAKLASDALPDMAVTTCHSYAVHTPYKWRCADAKCGTEYGKHSKKGIDIVKHRCGMCKGNLEYIGMFSADGSMQTPRAASGFSLFVKENFAKAKESTNPSNRNGVATQAEIMQQLSKMYHERKAKAKSVDVDVDVGIDADIDDITNGTFTIKL